LEIAPLPAAAKAAAPYTWWAASQPTTDHHITIVVRQRLGASVSMAAEPEGGWLPVDRLLDAASAQLRPGQLLATSVFSLFEAMSAVEIGNAKMDIGAWCRRTSFGWRRLLSCTTWGGDATAIPAAIIDCNTKFIRCTESMRSVRTCTLFSQALAAFTCLPDRVLGLHAAGARPRADRPPLDAMPLPTELDESQLIGVLDRMLCAEATWHNGGSVASTVYSSLYMLQPAR
jgi:Mak10 subunit, NatC N(alpha)-terminal acetyltransferase